MLFLCCPVTDQHGWNQYAWWEFCIFKMNPPLASCFSCYVHNCKAGHKKLPAGIDPQLEDTTHVVNLAVRVSAASLQEQIWQLCWYWVTPIVKAVGAPTCLCSRSVQRWELLCVWESSLSAEASVGWRENDMFLKAPHL